MSKGSAKRGTLLVVCLSTAMLMLDISVVNTALSHIAGKLHSSLGGIEWVVDAYSLTLAAAVLSAGSLADGLGRRRVFAVGMALFTVASLSCGLSSTITVLDVSRAIQGVGSALMFAPSLAILAEAFPVGSERSGALAAYSGAIGLSFVLGPFIGGALTSTLGWRSVFFVNVPLGLAGLAGTAIWVGESRDPAARRLDFAGVVTLACGLLLAVLALLRGNLEGWGSPLIVGELAGAAVLLGAFVVIEARAASPMMPLSLFRSARFSGAQVGIFAIAASHFALFVYLTLYLQEVLGLSPVETGLAYLPGALLQFLVLSSSARLARHATPGLLIVAGLVSTAAGLSLLTLTQAGSHWTVILPGVVLLNAGAGLTVPAISGVALSSIAEDQSGLAAGVHDAFRQAGIALGVAVYGVIVPSTAAVGHGPARAYVSGLHEALIAGAAVAAIGAVLCVRLIGLFAPSASAVPVRYGGEDRPPQQLLLGDEEGGRVT
jgi:EmrB/QacA subfamily drug resistance transporter